MRELYVSFVLFFRRLFHRLAPNHYWRYAERKLRAQGYQEGQEVRVLLPLTADGEDGPCEGAWAIIKQLAPPRFEIANIPFDRCWVNLGDVVTVFSSADGGQPIPARLLERKYRRWSALNVGSRARFEHFVALSKGRAVAVENATVDDDGGHAVVAHDEDIEPIAREAGVGIHDSWELPTAAPYIVHAMGTA